MKRLIIRLENVIFANRDSIWDPYLPYVMPIVDELPSFDEELSEKEEVANYICSRFRCYLVVGALQDGQNHYGDVVSRHDQFSLC